MDRIEHDIQPGVGLGQLLLGASEAQVRSLLGEPTSIGHEDFGDGVLQHEWEYAYHGLSLSFSADDGFRLGTITTRYEWASLRGLRVIGLTEADVVAGAFGGLGAPTETDDCGEFGTYYGWDPQGLSCWVQDAAVVNVCIMPLYDEDGDTPLWPSSAG